MFGELVANVLTRCCSMVAVVCLASGCLMETVTTEITVRDPSAVSLLSSEGTVVLPASSAPVTAPLGDSRAGVDVGSSAAYRVTARRDADGSISTDWSTTLPLANGDRHVLLPADGKIVVHNKPLADVVTPAMASASSLVLPMCAAAGTHGYRSIYWSVESNASVVGCRGAARVDTSLDIPWHAVDVVEHTRVDHGGAWLLIGLATMTFGTLATFIFATNPSDWHGGQATQIALGTATTAIGLGFDLAMLPTLFASDRDVRLRRE